MNFLHPASMLLWLPPLVWKWGIVAIDVEFNGIMSNLTLSVASIGKSGSLFVVRLFKLQKVNVSVNMLDCKKDVMYTC